MKFLVRIQSGSKTAEHSVDVPAGSATRRDEGKTDVLLDGQVVRTDWAATAPGIYSILIDGQPYRVRTWRSLTPSHGVGAYTVAAGAHVFELQLRDPLRSRHSYSVAQTGPQDLRAPMPGKVVKILAEEGASILEGQGLLVIEAMKMQNEVRAPRSGRLEKIHVSEGEGVEAGSRLVRLT